MIHIRRVTLEDCEFIAQTYRPFVEAHWASFEAHPPSASQIATRITNAGDQYPWLLAEDDVCLAYAYASPHRTRAAYQWAVDTTIYGAPEARGRGVGKKLYAALLNTLAQQNFVTAFAGIALPNEASIGLHKSVGFERIGTYQNVGYKHGAWRNTQWWSKSLAPAANPPNAILPVSSVFTSV